jgi:hypothetical protein
LPVSGKPSPGEASHAARTYQPFPAKTPPTKSHKESSAFLKKSAQKTLIYGRILRGPSLSPQESKVFCFFFSKKKRFLLFQNKFVLSVRPMAPPANNA